MAVGIYISSSGQVTVAGEGVAGTLTTDVEHLWDSSSSTMSVQLSNVLQKGPLAASFMCADAASYLGTVDLLKRGTYLGRTLIPTWAAALALVESDPNLEAPVLAVHVDGQCVELCIFDCSDEVVEVLEMARIGVDTDEQLFPAALVTQIGKLLFPYYRHIPPGSVFARGIIDIAVSAPGGPSDALVAAVRSALPPTGMTINEHRMGAIDLARGALVQARMLSGSLTNTLFLAATWWSVSLVCSGRRNQMMVPATTVPTSHSETFGANDEPALPSAIVMEGVSGASLELPLPSTGLSHAEITIDIDAGYAMRVSYRDLDQRTASATMTLRFEDLLRAYVKPVAPCATRPRLSPWEGTPSSPSSAGGQADVTGAWNQPFPGPTDDAPEQYVPTAGAVALRNALVQTLCHMGLGLLDDPYRLSSYAMDLVKDESPELRVLLLHADEELLEPFADAAATGRVEAIIEARRKTYLLLSEDRFIVRSVANGVAWALATATSVAMRRWRS